ncbi:hypothetical protein HPULCUR_003205 [Helicostylum pulchrum]|uniref:Uncharacterized protein n=1 Tax=Helicostylum pulchrum TaxID=562976 RepID=A0ABP9XU11_9FUNG
MSKSKGNNKPTAPYTKKAVPPSSKGQKTPSSKSQKLLNESQKELAKVQKALSTEICSTPPIKNQKVPSSNTDSSFTNSQELLYKTQKAHSKVQKCVSKKNLKVQKAPSNTTDSQAPPTFARAAKLRTSQSAAASPSLSQQVTLKRYTLIQATNQQDDPPRATPRLRPSSVQTEFEEEIVRLQMAK